MPFGTNEIILILAVCVIWIGILISAGYFGFRFFNRRFLSQTKACPHCAERIQLAAKVCRFCQRDL